MSNIPTQSTGQSSMVPDYRSSYQQVQHSSAVGATNGGASSIAGQTNGSSLQNTQGLQQYSQAGQRSISSTVPQSVQYQSGYYSDQNQQYQQMINNNYSNSLPQQQQQQQQQMMNQSYPSYYMYNQQQQPQQGSQQVPPPPHQSNSTDQSYPYGRYPYGASSTAATGATTSSNNVGATSATVSSAAPSTNTSSLYQQSVPQYSTQLTQAQPQSYNQGTSTAYSSTKNSESGQGQDTLANSSNSMVGQYQPPGIRPRVTTTMWEDEKTLCYQVDANNVSVVRRADNNMINGTKLLNVAQMTRGRRDGILKAEKVRHVVKIGSMHLKGVWIPFERALAMAQREGFVDLLYPLFVRDIKRVIQTGVTPTSGANPQTSKAITAPPPSIIPNPTPNPGLGITSYYPYNQQYPQNGTTSNNSGTQSQTSQQNSASVDSTHQSSQQVSGTPSVQPSLQPQPQPQHQPQPQPQSQPQPQPQPQQVYGYQQAYYAPNQYYQAYIPNNNYSTYNTPVYSTYGYMNQQVPQQVPQSMLQQSTSSNSSNPSTAANVSTQPTSITSSNQNTSSDGTNQNESNGNSIESSELTNEKKSEN